MVEGINFFIDESDIETASIHLSVNTEYKAKKSLPNERNALFNASFQLLFCLF